MPGLRINPKHHSKSKIWISTFNLREVIKNEEFTASSLINEQKEEIKAKTVEEFYLSLIEELKQKAESVIVTLTWTHTILWEILIMGRNWTILSATLM